jgi:membrane protease YdiL (CAAX protease family)
MRIRPTALVGVAIWLLYAAVVVVLQKVSGIPYTDFDESTSNMWRGVIPSLAVGAAVIGLLGRWMGWWGRAMRDRHRTRVPWTLVAPVLYLVIALGTFAGTSWGNVSGGFLLVALALGVLVGFAEEFVCRGMLLVGLRGTFREVAVWAVTSLLFGLMHGVNIFLGAPVADTVTQVAVAAVQGSAFYILRRYFGTLVWAMLLHGLWDMSIFVHDQSGAGPAVVGALVWVAVPFALVGGFVVARRSQRGQVEDYAVGAAVAGRAAP